MSQLQNQFAAAIGEDRVLDISQINDGLQGQINLDQSIDIINNKNNFDTFQLQSQPNLMQV